MKTSRALGLLAFAITTSLVVTASADPAGTAQSSATSTAKSEVLKNLSTVNGSYQNNKAAAQSGVTKSGFDTAGFTKDLATLSTTAVGSLKAKEEELKQKWGAAVNGILTSSGIDVKKEAEQLTKGLPIPLFSNLTYSGPASMAASSSTMTSSTSVPIKVGALTPSATSGVAISGPGGVLHTHAIQHDPTGAVLQSVASQSATFTVAAEANRVSVEYALTIPLALAFVAAGPGAAASDSRVEVRVMDGNTLICSDSRGVGRTAVAIAGIGIDVHAAMKGSVGCKASRTSGKESTYTVVVSAISTGTVQGLGGAHSILDVVIGAPTASYEKAK